MAKRRFKSAPYVRRVPLAFRVFGEIRPRLNMVVLRVWNYEDAPPDEVNCDSKKVALHRMELIREADMIAYDSYAREP